MSKESIVIFLCTKENELYSGVEAWHNACNCESKRIAMTHEGQELTWKNGVEWGGLIEHPDLGWVKTWYKQGARCYDTYTAPVVNGEGYVMTYRYDHDEGAWHEDAISVGIFNGEGDCLFL